MTAATPTQPRPTVIEVDDLVTHYGARRILDGVGLRVRQGEIMVIMGGSGSGKSTLLRHLLALEKPTSGRISLLGQDITQMDEFELYALARKMGVAFQGGALFSSMTVGENVMLPLREHTKLDRGTMQIMMRLKLEIVNLAGFEHLMPSELSGGMIKRAAFARAIIMDPALLFCDEPSAGLDPVVSAALDELILRLRDALGMTIVVVTHELESAFRIADRITVLDRGRILATGTVDEIRGSSNPRIQNLLQPALRGGDARPRRVPGAPDRRGGSGAMRDERRSYIAGRRLRGRHGRGAGRLARGPLRARLRRPPLLRGVRQRARPRGGHAGPLRGLPGRPDHGDRAARARGQARLPRRARHPEGLEAARGQRGGGGGAGAALGRGDRHRGRQLPDRCWSRGPSCAAAKRRASSRSSRTSRAS